MLFRKLLGRKIPFQIKINFIAIKLMWYTLPTADGPRTARWAGVRSRTAAYGLIVYAEPGLEITIFIIDIVLLIMPTVMGGGKVIIILI